jgi:hypothetical protein
MVSVNLSACAGMDKISAATNIIKITGKRLIFFILAPFILNYSWFLNTDAGLKAIYDREFKPLEIACGLICTRVIMV